MSLLKLAALFLAFVQSISLIIFKKPIPQTIFIDSSAGDLIFEGFGTSSCWWAQTINDDEKAKSIAKSLYSKTEGLGLDLFRYNIGAGEKDNPNSRIYDVNRRTESFYYFNESTGEYEYDFSRDFNARRVLDYAIQDGASEIILFCNSPHFSMTESKQASGGLSEYSSNLPEENYQSFVNYVLTIADWFVEQGYPVTAISPVNEPQWGWGGDWVGQEGCHYTPQETVKLLELFAKNMIERGCSYKLKGPESGQMSEQYYEYIDLFFGSEILNSYCDTYSGHSYWMDNNIVGKTAAGKYFAIKYPQKKYEMSEWCELPLKLDSNCIDSGLYMANVIIQDLTLMNAVSWQSWTAVNGDGLMDIINNRIVTYYRYYAYKQFSSFIEPGMTRIALYDTMKSKSQIASVAYKNNQKTVVIMVNKSSDDITVKLRGVCNNADIYTTSAYYNCELTHSGTVKSKTVLPAKSISTFVFYQ